MRVIMAASRAVGSSMFTKRTEKGQAEDQRTSRWTIPTLTGKSLDALRVGC
jgi:hypothetical protein